MFGVVIFAYHGIFIDFFVKYSMCYSRRKMTSIIIWLVLYYYANGKICCFRLPPKLLLLGLLWWCYIFTALFTFTALSVGVCFFPL